MRRSSSIAGLLALGALLAPLTGFLSAPVPAVVPIQVRIGCDGDTVGEFYINSQTARLSKSGGDTARFSLLGASDVTEVQVRPKAGVAWPFVDAPPSFGRGRDASTGAIVADIEPATYGYDLVVTCGGAERVIDPNMDIRP